MYMTGMGTVISAFFQTTTLLISIPSVIILTCLFVSLWGGSIRFNTPMLFALAFLPMFGIGGLTGLPLGFNFSDVALHDSYYVIAHFHYVVAPGTIFAIFAGVYYWFPKMTGRMYNETLGKWHFWLTMISFNVTFFVQHYIGLQGMPRRVADYDPVWADWNMVSSIGSFVLGASTLIFLYNMAVSWRSGEPAPSNPWRALTIEWQVSSPLSKFNFDDIPQVVGGPYEYGVPGARHVVLNGARTTVEEPEPATVGSDTGSEH